MKPNFALDFRNDAITLLHRTPHGWRLVGQVGLDEADLAGGLSYLRTTALELSPKGMTTKLVIPNSQILYTQVPVTVQDNSRRRKQVARALEGVTPYAVDDLAFDISGSGPVVDVAVIAKETLAEAEAFATEHRFNPVSFVAVPEVAGFTTEPWFGPTGCAPSHLAEGQRVDRDPTPVVILGREAAPAAPPVAAPLTAAPAPVADDSAPAEADLPPMQAEPPLGDQPAEAEPAPDPMPLAAAPEPDPVAPEADAAHLDEPAGAAPPAGDLWPAAAEPTPAEPPSPAARAIPAEPVLTSSAAAELEPEDVLAQMFATEQQPDDPAPAPAPLPDDEAPIALDVVDDLPDPLPDARSDSRSDTRPDARIPPAQAASASVLAPSIEDDLPPPPPASVMVAFGSRRALEASAKEAAARAGATKPAPGRPAAAGTAKAPALGSISATRTNPQAKVTTLPPRPSQPSVVRLPPRPGASTAPIPLDTLDRGGKASSKPATKTSAAGKALRGLGALVTSPGIAGAKERKPAVQVVTPPTGPTSAASAAAATLTNPGGKPGAKPYSGGLGNRSLERQKPRYLGLILTGILLVFLALVAAWSTLFLESRDTTTPDPNAVVQAPPAADVPAVEDEMAADLQDPAPAGGAGEGSAETDIAAATDSPAAEAPPVTTAEAVDAAVAEAVAEPAPIAPPDTEAALTAAAPDATPQDEFLLATMDEPPAMPDALSLPQPIARNDAPPNPAVPPPPFGTVYQFDADGLIVPTPEGILTPEGVLLFAGRPTRLPPPRPEGLAPAPAPALSDAAALSGAAEPAPFASDPALAGARPRARPASLTPPTQNADDDASLAPADGSRFASLRPRTKPAALAAAAVAAAAPAPVADLGAQAASLTAQANAAAAETAAAAAASNGPLSPLALAVSRKPAPRPKDLSAAVEAAVAVASRQPDPKPPVEEPKAKTEAEADDEPEVATAMPRLPTKTTVAKQATYVNAINLSKINLIGIYGSSSDRYALIRQTNGRYKKVKVGDSFDGGRVAAITTSEVRYQKSGKMVTLALPKG